MNFYLVPTTQGQPFAGGPTVNLPEYWDTDLAGIKWSSIPMGIEGIYLLALADPNAALAAEADVYTLPSSGTLADADVVNLSDYLSNYSVPSDWIESGQTWASVIQQIATIFLVAQAVSGTTGAGIFAGTTVTVDTPMSGATSSKSVRIGGKQQLQSTPVLPAGPAGVFDFSNVDPSSTVGDALVSVASQFSGPISIGGGTL